MRCDKEVIVQMNGIAGVVLVMALVACIAAVGSSSHAKTKSTQSELRARIGAIMRIMCGSRQDQEAKVS